MENLNAEQVKKALECCTSYCDKDNCPYKTHDNPIACMTMRMIDALALINKQETEYNELYELCESYRIERDAMRGAANSYKLHCKTLEKENEGLKTLLDESYDAQNTVKADTVRKMQERLKSEIAKYFLPTFRFQANAFIDQIAKEMLEGK